MKNELKRMVRTAVRSAKRWLQDEPATANNGEPPLGYVDSVCARILKDDPARPNYVWGTVNAAILAKVLQIPRISVLELGVAGGNGLVALERIAGRVTDELQVEIDVYGFDTGSGLPKPVDYRDMPHLFAEGSFSMDVDKLCARLQKADLRLGFVQDTIPEFISSNPAPIGFIAFDLDLYSSTAVALRLLDADHETLLPRIYCYFDDILAFTYNEFSGELLAISEFNNSHTMRKISKINGLHYAVPQVCHPGAWVEQVYIAHIFDHELYGRYDGSNPRTSLDLLVAALVPIATIIPVIDLFLMHL